MNFLASDYALWPSWWPYVLLPPAALLIGLVAHALLRPVLRRLAAFSVVATEVVRRCDRPARILLPVVLLEIAWRSLPDSLPIAPAVEHVNGIATIAAASAFLVQLIRGVAEGVIAKFPADVADNLAARRIHTQTRVLARIACGTVILAGIAFILMTFPRARQFGASLLASAGVAGLIVGIAARSVFSNLLAGLQIALAQPIRIDDVLIVEGEWGRVEEITATYVVLKLWDERRLVVPLGWFIEHPFQNWTRRSASLLGTVFLWVDYATVLEPLRAEARRLCEASSNWDGRVCLVQVTDCSERAMQLRVLVSSQASGPCFDLRCEVREGLLAFLHRTQPGALPRLRMATSGGELAPGATSAAG
jgi:small-conductance mechanosensitive channel